MRRMNVRPGGTARAAWPSFPTRDSSSLLEQDFRPTHVWISSWSSINFTCGSRMINTVESSSKPKNVS